VNTGGTVVKRGIAIIGLASLACIVLALAGCFLIPKTPDDYSPITETEAQKILDVFDAGAAMFEQLGDDPTIHELDEVAEWFLSQENVRSVSKNEEGILWIQFDCGLLASLSGHQFAGELTTRRSNEAAASSIQHRASTSRVVGGRAEKSSSARAVIFSPFALDGDDWWWWRENCKTARDGIRQLGYDESQIDDLLGHDASLDGFRSLDQYDVIFILTHGSTGSTSQWFVLGERPFAGGLSELWNWYKSKTVIGMTLSEGAIRYQVSDLFFDFEDMSFPGSVVFLNACTSMKKTLFSSALHSAGAGAVFGWSNTTNAWFVQEAMRDLLSAAAIPHSTMDQAYDVVEPMFPGVVRKNLDGDQLGFYELSNEESYGDPDDADSPIVYSTDFVFDGGMNVGVSELSWAESNSELYAIGVTKQISDVSVGEIRDDSEQLIDITDIAYSLSDDLLYGVSYGQLVKINTDGCSLVKKSTRTATPIGDGLGLLYETSALACDSSGNLYGGTVGGDFLSINRNTGQAAVIGSYGSSYLASGDLAFDKNDLLYGSAIRDDEANDVLVKISTSTGTATLIGSTGYDKVYGLFFMGDDLYGVTEDNELISIDTSTGVGTFIRDLSFSAWGAQDLGE
jgi:hypothetical protein